MWYFVIFYELATNNSRLGSKHFLQGVELLYQRASSAQCTECWSESIHCKYRHQTQCNCLHQYKEKSTYVTELAVGGSRLPGKGKNEATVLLQERERAGWWDLTFSQKDSIRQNYKMHLSTWQHVFVKIYSSEFLEEELGNRFVARESWPMRLGPIPRKIDRYGSLVLFVTS